MKTLFRSIVSPSRPACYVAALLLGLAAGGVRAEDGYTYSKLHVFSGGDGAGPEGALIQDGGAFYGTTSGNFYSPKTGATAAAAHGTIFQLTPAGKVTTLHVFTGSDGSNPQSPLVLMPNGYLYGTTSGGFSGSGITIFRLAPDGTGFATLAHGAAKEGITNATLARGKDGNLYGTNRQGGAYGYGMIFRMTPAGVLTTLYSFKGHPDGEFPNGPLLQAANGTFYGCCGGGGAGDEGTIFSITAAGVYKSLYSLAAYGTQGSGPQGLVQAGDGNFYGTCQQGGTEDGAPVGTLFRITPAGVFTKLVDLSSGFGTTGVKAYDPVCAMIVGPDGALYGTGKEAGDTGTGYGGVFRLSLTGEYSDLYGFDGTDGAYVFAGLLLATDGNLYGLTAGKIAETDSNAGGDQYGTVFKLARATVAPTPTPTPTATPTPTPAGLPTLTVVATTPVTIVGSDVPGVFTFNLSAVPTTKLVVHYTLKGAAINGTDYELLTGKVKFKPGKGISKAVQVVPKGDLGGAYSKKVKLVITPDDALFTDGTPGAVKVKIKQ